MDLNAAIVFPDTVPAGRMISPLVPVFEPLVYFQTMEDDQIPPELVDQVTADLQQAGSIQVKVPAPLGDDRDRFLRLVRDLRERRDDYAAQLGHLTLAGVSSASRPARETKSSIVGALLSSRGIRTRDDDARRLELWQARLVLKLAEIYDADQVALGRELARLGSRQESLLAELRRESDAPFFRTKELLAVPPVSGERLQLRLKAWTRLVLADSSAFARNPVLITAGREPLDALADVYHADCGQEITGPFDLELPAELPKDRIRELCAGLRSTAGGLMTGLAGFVNSAGTQEVAGAEMTAWSEALERFCPEASCGRVRLRLYGFPGAPAARLLARAFSAGHLTDGAPGGSDGFVVGILDEA